MLDGAGEKMTPVRVRGRALGSPESAPANSRGNHEEKVYTPSIETFCGNDHGRIFLVVWTRKTLVVLDSPREKVEACGIRYARQNGGGGMMGRTRPNPNLFCLFLYRKK